MDSFNIDIPYTVKQKIYLYSALKATQSVVFIILCNDIFNSIIYILKRMLQNFKKIWMKWFMYGRNETDILVSPHQHMLHNLIPQKSKMSIYTTTFYVRVVAPDYSHIKYCSNFNFITSGIL